MKSSSFHKSIVTVTFGTTLLVALDQLSKAAARKLPSTVANTGSAFGTLQGAAPYLVVLSVAMALAILLLYRKLTQRLERAGAILILAGIIGNSIDRAFHGAVTDFITLPFWPSFNLADCFLTSGAALLIFAYIKQRLAARTKQTTLTAAAPKKSGKRRKK